MSSESFVRVSTSKVRERCQYIVNNPEMTFYGTPIDNPIAKTLLLMCDLAEESGEDTIYMTRSDIELIFGTKTK